MEKHELTDLGNAHRLYDLFGSELKYSLQTKWMAWNNKVWEDGALACAYRASKVHGRIRDEAAQIWDDEGGGSGLLDKKTMGALQKRMKKYDTAAEKAQSAGGIEGMLHLARSLPSLYVHPDRLNFDHHLLNLQNGILDLDKGSLNEHDPERLMTCLSGTSWDESGSWFEQEPEAGEDSVASRIDETFDIKSECPKWDWFLNDIFQGSERLIETVRQCFGYSLSGYASEHCIFVLHGSGRNGKGTLVHVLQKLLGTYCKTTPVETLMAKKYGTGVPNDLARLMDARVVLASEGDSGETLAESLVKRITGEDTIACRYLHKEFFEFTPRFKVWFTTNHKPELKNVDPAMRDRIRMIPFEMYYSPERRDPDLKSKLEKELPGILRWAVGGYQAWLDQGKRIEFSSEVVDATAEYFEEQDTMGQFILERCERSPGNSVLSTDVYVAYKKWAEDQKLAPLSQKAFSPKFFAQGGIEKKKSHGRILFLKIRLVDSAKAEEIGWNLNTEDQF